MSPETLGISDWGIMIHLFFLHLPTKALLVIFHFPREAERDLIQFSKRSRACTMHSPSLSHTSSLSYYSEKTHIRAATLSFLARLHSTQKTALSDGTRSREFPIFSFSLKIGKGLVVLVDVAARISVCKTSILFVGHCA